MRALASLPIRFLGGLHWVSRQSGIDTLRQSFVFPSGPPPSPM